MSAFDILHRHYAPAAVEHSEIPADVLDVLARHGCAGAVDGETTAAGAMAMEVYALGKSRSEGKESA